MPANFRTFTHCHSPDPHNSALQQPLPGHRAHKSQNLLVSFNPFPIHSPVEPNYPNRARARPVYILIEQ
jgi:hypothetical protein